MISSTRRAAVLLLATFALGVAAGAAVMAYASRLTRGRHAFDLLPVHSAGALIKAAEYAVSGSLWGGDAKQRAA